MFFFEKNEILIKDQKEVINSKINWLKFKNKKILITGGYGFIFGYLAKILINVSELYQLNLKIYILGRDKKKFRIKFMNYLDYKNLFFYKSDLSDVQSLDLNFDFIIHSASYANPSSYYDKFEDIFSINALGTKNILENIGNKNKLKFLFISSGEVYGDLKKKIINENDYGIFDHTNLRSIYSLSKKFGELFSFYYADKFNLKINIARVHHTYGPTMDLNDGRVHSDFVKNIINSQKIIIKSNGDAQRCFCYITDTCDALIKILLEGKNKEIYNVANPNEFYSINDLAKNISSFFYKKNYFARKKTQSEKYLSSSITCNARPSIDKIRNNLKWEPKINLQEGFERTINYFNEN